MFALAFNRQPVTAGWLVGVTGYTDKTINVTLNLLVEYGQVTRNGRYAWQIAAGVQALPFGADSEPDPGVGKIPSRAFPRRLPGRRRRRLKTWTRCAGRESTAWWRKNSPGRHTSPPGIRIVIQAVFLSGVELHAHKARQEGCRTGLLVYRMCEKDPAPDEWGNSLARQSRIAIRHGADGFNLPEGMEWLAIRPGLLSGVALAGSGRFGKGGSLNLKRRGLRGASCAGGSTSASTCPATGVLRCRGSAWLWSEKGMN